MDCLTNPDLIAKYRDYIFNWKEPFSSIDTPFEYDVTSKRIRTDKGWKIPFKDIDNISNFEIIAKKIRINKSCECEIAFSISKSSEYLKLQLMIIHNNEKEVFVKIKLVNTKHHSIIASKYFKSHGKKVYFASQDFFKREIIWPTSNSQASSDYFISIRVREMLQSSQKSIHAGMTIMALDDNPITNLVENYDALLKGSEPDFTLEVGQTQFHAHKCILRLKSSMFSKMLEHKMKENLTNRMKIENFNEQTIDNLLHFLYWNCLKDTSVNLCQLYDAARFYQVEDLEFYCLEMIKSKLNCYNMFDVYTDACLHMLDEVMKVCVEFMKANLDEKNLFKVFYIAMKEKNEKLKERIRKYICSLGKKFFQKKDWKEFATNYPTDAVKILEQYVVDKVMERSERGS